MLNLKRGGGVLYIIKIINSYDTNKAEWDVMQVIVTKNIFCNIWLSDSISSRSYSLNAIKKRTRHHKQTSNLWFPVQERIERGSRPNKFLWTINVSPIGVCYCTVAYQVFHKQLSRWTDQVTVRSHNNQ